MSIKKAFVWISKTKVWCLVALTLFGTVWGLSGQNSLEERIASVKTAIEENKAPDGFTWEYVGEINAAFLKPDGWIVSKKLSGNFFILGLSEEDPATLGKFQHGFTVIASKLGDKDKSVIEFIRNARDGLLEKNNELSRKDVDFGTLKGFNALYVLEKQQLGMFVLFVGNPDTNTFYQIIFESPVREFDSYWQDFGGQMADSFLLDDEL